MPRKTIGEQTILKELHQVPKNNWGLVLSFIRSLQPGGKPAFLKRPILSGADLAGSDLIGIWADRSDIADSREFALRLRHQAEHRRGMTDAAGH